MALDNSMWQMNGMECLISTKHKGQLRKKYCTCTSNIFLIPKTAVYWNVGRHMHHEPSSSSRVQRVQLSHPVCMSDILTRWQVLEKLFQVLSRLFTNLLKLILQGTWTSVPKFMAFPQNQNCQALQETLGGITKAVTTHLPRVSVWNFMEIHQIVDICQSWPM